MDKIEKKKGLPYQVYRMNKTQIMTYSMMVPRDADQLTRRTRTRALRFLLSRVIHLTKTSTHISFDLYYLSNVVEHYKTYLKGSKHSSNLHLP